MYSNNMETKDIHKSLRFSQRVYDYIDTFEGDNFNQKFSRMIYFFCDEEENKQKQIQYYEKQIQEKVNVLKSLTEKIAKLHTLNRDLTALFQEVDWLQKKVKDLDVTVSYLLEK